jgi:hypothetical protein
LDGQGVASLDGYGDGETVQAVFEKEPTFGLFSLTAFAAFSPLLSPL